MPCTIAHLSPSSKWVTADQTQHVRLSSGLIITVVITLMHKTEHMILTKCLVFIYSDQFDHNVVLDALSISPVLLRQHHLLLFFVADSLWSGRLRIDHRSHGWWRHHWDRKWHVTFFPGTGNHQILRVGSAHPAALRRRYRRKLVQRDRLHTETHEGRAQKSEEEFCCSRSGDRRKRQLVEVYNRV